MKLVIAAITFISAFSSLTATNYPTQIEEALSDSIDVIQTEGKVFGDERLVYKLGDKTPFSGYVRNFYEDGILLSLTPYSKGLRSGTAFEFHNNGNLKSVLEYEFGRLDGSVVNWDENGENHFQTIHSEGILLRKMIPMVSNTTDPYFEVTVYYNNGTVSAEGLLLNGERYLDWTEYHVNGEKKSHVNYLEGIADGKATYWNEDGSLDKTVEYEAGKLKQTNEESEDSTNDSASSANQIPANLSGRWSNEGVINSICFTQLEIDQINDQFDGVIEHIEYSDQSKNKDIAFSSGRSASIIEGKINGNNATFKIIGPRGGVIGSGTIEAKGKNLHTALMFDSRPTLTAILSPDIFQRSPDEEKEISVTPNKQSTSASNQPATRTSSNLKPEGMSDLAFLVLLFFFIGFWVWLFSGRSKKETQSTSQPEAPATVSSATEKTTTPPPSAETPEVPPTSVKPEITKEETVGNTVNPPLKDDLKKALLKKISEHQTNNGSEPSKQETPSTKDEKDAAKPAPELTEEAAKRIANATQYAQEKAHQLFQSYLTLLEKDKGDFIRSEYELPGSKGAIRKALIMKALQANESPDIEGRMHTLIRAWNTLDFFGNQSDEPPIDRLALITDRIDLAGNKNAETILYSYLNDDWLSLGKDNIHRISEKWREENWNRYKAFLADGETRIECLRYFGEGKFTEDDLQLLRSMAQQA